MTITRANVEAILIRRTGKMLTAAGLDGATANGANVDLNDPIGYALRQCGVSVTDIAAVSNADVASLSDDALDQMLDIAELRVLMSIEGNLDQVDITVGPRSESLNQLGARVRAKIEAKQKQIEKTYGVGLATLEAGTISLDFAEHGDDE